MAELHHHEKARAQEYFDKAFRLIPEITELTVLQYMFENSVHFLSLSNVSPANLEKIENLGGVCVKRAQVALFSPYQFDALF